jgi:transcriptional regulator with XRE-family HTH domain
MLTRNRTLLTSLLNRLGLTTADLAAELGKSVGTIRNVASDGEAGSLRLREQIALFLGESVWSDIQVRKFTFPKGAELVYATEAEARRTAAEFPEVEVVGTTARFTRATNVVSIVPRSLEKPPPNERGGRRGMKKRFSPNEIPKETISRHEHTNH